MTMIPKARLNRRTHLVLEQLEDRMVPATVSFISGNLYISNPTGNLQVTQQPTDGSFVITDNGHFNGRYNVGGNITINTGNLSHLVTVTLDNTDGNGILPGSLTINGGNGNDTVNINGTTGSEFIGGNVSVNDGFGNQVTDIGTTTGLNIGGNTTLVGNSGFDTVNTGNTGATAMTFRGSLSVYATQSVNFGAGTNADTVGGNFLATLQMSPTNTSFKVAPLNVALEANSQVFGNAKIIGGVLPDSVHLLGSSINGSATVTLSSSGHNNLEVGTTIGFGNTAGSMTYNGGQSDTITIDTGTSIANNLTLNTGGGDTFAFNHAFTVLGNMTLSEPTNGLANNIGDFWGDIVGTLTFTLSNGNSTFTFDGANGARATRINYTSGTGNNTVTVNAPAGIGPYTLDLEMTFGNFGTNQVTITGGDTNATLTGNVTFGTGPHTYNNTVFVTNGGTDLVVHN